MILLPIVLPPDLAAKSGYGPVLVFVILEEENLRRMRQADPVDISFRAYAGKGLPVNRPIGDLDLVIAYEADAAKLHELIQQDDLHGLIQWVERGRVFREGDAAPPRSLRPPRPRPTDPGT